MYNFRLDCVAPAVCEFLKFGFSFVSFFEWIFLTRIIILRKIIGSALCSKSFVSYALALRRKSLVANGSK